MVLLDQLWDDVVAGPPGRGLKHLKRVFITTPLNVKVIGESSGKIEGSLSMPGTPVTPGTPANTWRNVFHPGSNPATKGIGSNIFDKPHTVYDCSIFCWLD